MEVVPQLDRSQNQRRRFERTRVRGAALVATLVCLNALAPPGAAHAVCVDPPGDFTGNGTTNVADIVCIILSSLWQITDPDGAPPECLAVRGALAADANCDGSINVVDVQITVNHALSNPLPAEVDADGNDCPDTCDSALAPELTIVSPVADSVFAALEPIEVSGTVDGDDVSSIHVNGIPAAINGDSWTAAAVPVAEGLNVLTAAAVSSTESVGVATVQVFVDTTPPLVAIESPPPGVVLASVEADVAGLVNDTVPGSTIQPDDVTVVVNGIEAMVSHRSWVVPNLPLQPGPNTLLVTATDAAGNARSTSMTVAVDPEAGQRLLRVSGNGQTAQPSAALVEPLVVSAVDAAGDPLAGVPVDFFVSRGDGELVAPPDEGEAVRVVTDDDGLAAVSYVMGTRTGGGNNRVFALADGFVGYVEFCFASEPLPPVRVTAEEGHNQTGTVGQPLPIPLKVIVTDTHGNPVEGVPLTYEVVTGGATIGGSTTYSVASNSDGQAIATPILGDIPGLNNTLIQVSYPGLLEAPATFRASSELPGLASQTSVSGLVLTNQDLPMPDVTAQIEGTTLVTTTDAEGRFSLTGVPVGTVRLLIEGETTSLEGAWPHLEYELHTVAGQDNDVGMPIYLPQIDEGDGAAALVGGGFDVTLRMRGVPGATLTVFANSVTCPDGSSECVVAFSQVNSERVPMPAPMGSAFMLASTIQPSDTLFDPPARLCIPNDGREPGEQVEVQSFDHDIEEWVAVGTATVTEDGGQICSDPGFGVVKAGWHGCAPPPPPKRCVSECDDGNPCTSDACVDFQCEHNPVNAPCEPDDDPCTFDVCDGGSCTHPPKADGLSCQSDPDQECVSGQCQGGACIEEPAPDMTACTGKGQTSPSDEGCFDWTCMSGSCTTANKPDDTPCGDMECGPGLCQGGQCETPDEGTPCDDEMICTEDDLCKDGQCQGEEIKYDSTFKQTFNILTYISLLLDPLQAASSVTPCSLDVVTKSKSDGEGGGGKPGLVIDGELSHECCEDKNDIKTDKVKISGTGSFGASLECLLFGIKLPGFLKGLVELGVFVTLAAGGNMSLSWEESECTDTSQVCLSGGMSGSIQGDLRAQLFDDSFLSISGGGSASAGASAQCCSGGAGSAKGFLGKLEVFINATVWPFNTYSWTYTVWDGLTTDGNFGCPNP